MAISAWFSFNAMAFLTWLELVRQADPCSIIRTRGDTMSRQGVVSKDGKHFVNIDVTHARTRYHFEGPRRQDAATAQEDLTYIYSAASTGTTRAEGLQAMKVAATNLRDEAKVAAKATTRGSIKEEGPTGHYARIQYMEGSTKKEICGPCRRSERHA